MSKYFEHFNFYFSKPINEILVNVASSEVTLFKDFQYYDNINEYLKRPYLESES